MSTSVTGFIVGALACRRKNVLQPDLAGLTKPKASELIDSLNDGSYDPAQWSLPF